MNESSDRSQEEIDNFLERQKIREILLVVKYNHSRETHAILRNYSTGEPIPKELLETVENAIDSIQTLIKEATSNERSS